MLYVCSRRELSAKLWCGELRFQLWPKRQAGSILGANGAGGPFLGIQSFFHSTAARQEYSIQVRTG